MSVKTLTLLNATPGHPLFLFFIQQIKPQKTRIKIVYIIKTRHELRQYYH